MIEVIRDVPASPEDVFAVLADGWSYAGWVVGNSHIRDVDANWPAPGARIHHSAGAWPMQIRDVTEVRAVEPGRMLELEARVQMLAHLLIRFTLTPLPDGGTRVVQGEEAIDGLGKLIPTTVQALLLRPRNAEALARLSDMAVGKARLASTTRSGTGPSGGPR